MAYMPQHVQLGMGEYDRPLTPWTWMFYPPPYDFADPLQIKPPPTFIAPAEQMDMGPASMNGYLNIGDAALPLPGSSASGMGCGCGCGGGCSSSQSHPVSGMGQLSLYVPFQSGFDLSGWGWEEWAIVLVGAYALVSMVFTTGRAAGSVRSGYRRRKSRAAKKAQLQAAADAL